MCGQLRRGRFLACKMIMLPALILVSGCASVAQITNSVAEKVSKGIEIKIESQTVSGGMDSGVTLYRPLSTSRRIEGLYAKQDQQLANYGKLAYPRVALAFLKYGPHLKCWDVQATIWSSPASSADETFRICDTDVVVKDDVGNKAVVSFQAMNTISNKLEFSTPPLGMKNTGGVRSRGPLPPEKPFKMNFVKNDMFKANPLSVRFNNIVSRIAYISGYIPLRNASPMELVQTAFYDYRMWVWKFEEGGLVE